MKSMITKDYPKLPIIMLSMSRWDGPFSSASISLAKEFAKNNLVFYIDNPFTLKDIGRLYKQPEIQSRKKALFFGHDIYKVIDPSLKNLIGVTPKFAIPINWLPASKIYDAFSSFNNKVIIETIRNIKKDHNIKDYILFNSFNPFYGHDLPKDIKPAIKIYQSRDDISESEYVNKHGVKLETKAILNADVSFATSIGLVKKLSKNNKKIHYLPNAADIDIFKDVYKPLAKPKELLNIDKKIIIYTGNICHRIDYELLKKIAADHHDKIVLLVGPISNKQFFDYNLDKMANVITTGPKPINALPSYLKYSDCTIIPFHCNELTKSIYPLKINEYLATGKPVVSTNFSEDIASFENVIFLSKNHEDFLSGINNALNEDKDQLKAENRVAIAESNTWSARVDLFWSFVKNLN